MPDVKTCPDPDVLRRLWLGELAGADLEQASNHVLDCDRCAGVLNEMRADDPLLQTLRGGDTATSLPPVVQSLIARITHAPASVSGDDTLASPDSALLSPGTSGAESEREAPSAEREGPSGPRSALGAPRSAPADAHVHLRPPQTPDELGRLGGYRVLRLLGEGGMGSVFLAEDVHLERLIALKVMRPDLAAKPEARQRFLREAKSTAKLKNDHVVAIYQVGEDNNVPFLAMEYLEGESLENRLKRAEPIPLAELLRIGREITQGLAAAHAKGLVHRDIKPANLWLETRGEAPGTRGENDQDLLVPRPSSLAPRVKILDFGLARGGVEDAQITQSGTILGTPAFMAPEQARGEPADARSDLFSLGCVLYRLCTGKTPFEGPTVMSVLTALATQDPVPVGQVNRDIPEALAGLVMRLLAKRPEDRPTSAQAVLDELRAIERQPAQESQTLPLPPKMPPAVAAPLAPSLEPPANKQTQVQPRRSQPWVKVGAALLGVAAIIGLGGLIIRITGKDGKVTELTVPEGSKVALNEKNEIDVKLPGEKEKVQPAPVVPVTNSPFDKLDPNEIPGSERFPWQPKELVAVIGKHERRSWSGHYSAAFSPDGSLAATGDDGPTVIWDVKTQTPKTVIPSNVVWGPEYHPSTVSVSFLAGGKQVLCLRRANGVNLQLWDISGNQPMMLPFAKAEKAGPFWGPWHYALPIENDNTVVALGNNFHLNLIDLSGPKRDITVQPTTIGGPGGLGGWAVASKSSQVFYAGKDKKLHRATIKNSHIDNDEILPIPFAAECSVRAVTPDGGKLVIWAGKELQVWDLAQQQPKIFQRISAQPAVSSECQAVISPDGKWLAAKYSHTALFRLDTPEPKLAGWLDQTDSSGFNGAVAFSPDARKAIVANNNGLVRFRDVSGAAPKELSPFEPGATFPADYWTNLASTFDRVAGGLLLRTFAGQPIHGQPKIRWQHWALGAKRPQAGPFVDVDWGSFSASGRDSWVLTTFFASRQYRLADGNIQQRGEPFGPANVRGATSPDGGSLIVYTTAAPLALECWDLTSPNPKQKWAITPKDHTPLVGYGGGQVWFSADNRWFVTQAEADKEGGPWKLVLWRNTTPAPEVHAVLPITWHRQHYRAVLSPDGHYLAHTPSSPDEVVLLDLSGKSPREIGKVSDPEKINGEHANLSFHPDSNKLAVGSWGGVWVLDVPALKPAWYWKSPGLIAWLDWAADGRHLVTHNGNMTLYVLRLDQFGKTTLEPTARASPPASSRPKTHARVRP